MPTDLSLLISSDHDPSNPLRARPLSPPAPRSLRRRRDHARRHRRALRPAATRWWRRWQTADARYLARVHGVLRSSLSQAMRWGWIWDNPAERAHRITTVPKEIRPPTPIELRTRRRGHRCRRCVVRRHRPMDQSGACRSGRGVAVRVCDRCPGHCVRSDRCGDERRDRHQRRGRPGGAPARRERLQ